MISEDIIQKAVELLIEAANPVKIILFGSYAKGQVDENSDLDFLVIKKEVKARRMEMVRLSDVLRPLRIPVDVIVASETVYNEWADTPGTVLYEAAKKGRVLYEMA
ncbi:MAG TPA: nucleotidyltransferase domain-containing protein [Syntrophaceae bacterium]|nr:nucleotidyltransferase domain-containing protein [Syntrophaceae bacterium]